MVLSVSQEVDDVALDVGYIWAAVIHDNSLSVGLNVVQSSVFLTPSLADKIALIVPVISLFLAFVLTLLILLKILSKSALECGSEILGKY